MDKSKAEVFLGIPGNVKHYFVVYPLLVPRVGTPDVVTLMLKTNLGRDCYCMHLAFAGAFSTGVPSRCTEPDELCESAGSVIRWTKYCPGGLCITCVFH